MLSKNIFSLSKLAIMKHFYSEPTVYDVRDIVSFSILLKVFYYIITAVRDSDFID